MRNMVFLNPNKNLKYLLVFILLVSCTRHKADIETEDIYQDMHRIYSHLCLVDHQYGEALTDSSTIIFVSERFMGQTQLLVIKNMGNQIRVVYHEVDSLNELYRRDNLSSLFFNGFKCEIEYGVWKQTIERAKVLLERSNSADYNKGKVDGENYILSYNGKNIQINDGKSLNDFKEFSKYLDDVILSPVKKLRKIPSI